MSPADASEAPLDPTRLSLAHDVRQRVEQLIFEENLQAGDQLPTENALMASFDVGRTTVREAFRLLEQEGVVASRRGSGRYVKSRPSLQRPLTRLEGVTDMLASRGFVPENVVLSVATVDGTQREREQLQVPSGHALVRLERLRRHGEAAVVYSVDHFDRALVSGAVADRDWAGSLFGFLAEAGRPVASAVTTVSAVTMDPELADRLDMARGTPWLLLEQEHFDEAGRPVLLSLDYHRGNDFSFQVQRRRD